MTKPISSLKILAIDTGSLRLGLALWNPEAQLAKPLEFRRRKNLKADIDFLSDLVCRHKVEAILVGLPISLDGKDTESTKNARFWVDKLKENFKIPIFTHDESMSTVEAEQILAQTKQRNKREKKDSLSAALFLEDFIRVQKI